MPLNTGAWAVHEHVLSSRIIHFSKQQSLSGSAGRVQCRKTVSIQKARQRSVNGKLVDLLDLKVARSAIHPETLIIVPRTGTIVVGHELDFEFD